MIGGTRNRKGEYQWCGNELYDWNCNLKRYSWQLTVWEKQKIIQALQYNSITVSINHIFALGSENVTRITWMTRIFICKFPPFLISHRYSGAAKTEWKFGFALLSRVRISQRQITEIYYPRNTRRTRKRLKLKKRSEEGVRVHFRLWFICCDMRLAYIIRRELWKTMRSRK